MKSPEATAIPSRETVEAELARLKNKRHGRSIWFSTLGILAVVAAVSVLIAVMVLPILEVTGTSMEPTLAGGDIVVCYKTSNISKGDMYCFSFGNRMVIKRVIAKAGDWVSIDENGQVSVNSVALDEDYIKGLAPGDGDITYPYQVPDGSVFVLGDNRETSIDSRYSEMGCLPETEIVGKVIGRLWPLKRIGIIN